MLCYRAHALYKVDTQIPLTSATQGEIAQVRKCEKGSHKPSASHKVVSQSIVCNVVRHHPYLLPVLWVAL